MASLYVSGSAKNCRDRPTTLCVRPLRDPVSGEIEEPVFARRFPQLGKEAPTLVQFRVEAPRIEDR